MPARQSTPTYLHHGVRLLLALAYTYLAILLGWALLHLLFADRWWWLFILTALAPWLFLPLAGVIPLALVTRRRGLLLSTVAGLLLGIAIIGDDLLPATRGALAAGAPQLTVMSFNVLGGNPTPTRVAETIRASNADLVAIQELDLEVAATIERELAGLYPYRLLEPRPGVTGMGLLSRYPLHTQGSLPGGWVGDPQIVTLDFAGQEVMVVNFHAIPPLARFAGSREGTIRERERQATALVALATGRGKPFLALGDLNSTPQHRAYKILHTALGDAWLVRGGPGFTWPAPGSSELPFAFVRIDHIFHSAHWVPLDATVGAGNNGADHLPLVATLALR